MLISEINPFLRFSSCYILFPHKTFLQATDCRIFYVVETENNGLIQISTENYFFKRNSLIYIPSNTPYKFVVTGVTKLISLNFDFTQYKSEYTVPFERILAKRTTKAKPAESFTDYEPLNTPIFLEDADFLFDTLNRILKVHSSSKLHFNETCSALLKLLIIDITNAYEKNILLTNPFYVKNKDTIRKVKQYIHEHYKENLTNDIIAHQVDYHSYHLNRVFNQLEGVTIHKYLNNYRIQMAEKLLLETNYAITFIATDVGFDNTTSFTQNFKAKNNITPSKFRNLHRKVL